ncbi:MAG: hypothetical protein ABJL44_12310 [Algibacter sp.]
MKVMKIMRINLFILLCYMQGFSQIYVSTTGNDTTGTGTSTLPYATIAQGILSVATGGTVYVSPGTYPVTGPMYIGKPLTVAKNGTGAVIVDASGWTSTDTYVLGIVNTNNVTINGLTIKNKIGNGSKGIWVLANSGATSNLSDITIKNCTVTNIGWTSHDLSTSPASSSIVANAIKIDGGNGTYAIADVTLENNTVYNCATGWGEAVTLTGNVDGFTVTKNTVYDIANIGIVAAGNYTSTGATSNNQARNGKISLNEVYDCMSTIANSAGIYLDGSKNCTVTRNEVYNCGVGISVGAEQDTSAGFGGTATGHIINNNSIYNNVITGAIIGGVIGSGYTTSLANTAFYNNTFYKNRTGATINGVTTVGGIAVSTIADNFGGEVHLQNSSGVTFKNNIIYASTNKKALLASFGYTVSSFVSDYNLYYRDTSTTFIIDLTGVSFNGSTTTGSYSPSQFATATGLETNAIVGLPGFTNAAIFDFGLVTAAFATDKGDTTYSSTYSNTLDFDGDTRLRNGRIDIGCSELQTGTSKSSKVKDGITSSFKIYNSLESNEINIDFGETIKHAKVSMVDLSGRTVFKKDFNNTNLGTFTVSELKKSGQIFVLKVETDTEKSNHKIYLE